MTRREVIEEKESSIIYPINDLITLDGVDVRHRRKRSDKIDFVRRCVDSINEMILKEFDLFIITLK